MTEAQYFMKRRLQAVLGVPLPIDFGSSESGSRASRETGDCLLFGCHGYKTTETIGTHGVPSKRTLKLRRM